MKLIVRLMLCLIISFTLIESPIISGARANMISTSDVVADLSRAQSQERVNEFLSREDVKNQMMKWGITSEEASLRIAGLSDNELRKLAGEIEKSAAGGDALIGILTVILLVVLIVYLVKRV